MFGNIVKSQWKFFKGKIFWAMDIFFLWNLSLFLLKLILTKTLWKTWVKLRCCETSHYYFVSRSSFFFTFHLFIVLLIYSAFTPAVWHCFSKNHHHLEQCQVKKCIQKSLNFIFIAFKIHHHCFTQKKHFSK